MTELNFRGVVESVVKREKFPLKQTQEVLKFLYQ